ncbi:5-oxoprolinase subunit PxpB [Siphonobacter curvatus]|uniref:Carboxyltransferase domain-containing protein n=1 Tax=Siphonobacter curvatus TaxID=2094562 RepID=A0A2S7IPN5_9BACT|nr:5-oxoprolinase subunit PxpB [Siphonobacter curvatus]PQA59652.1 hypothetical protein C5O19_08470 [Siphonobacter curvatus]
MIPPVHCYVLSERALVIAWVQRIDPAIAASIRKLQKQLTNQPFEGMLELVPAYASLTVFYDPLRVRNQYATSNSQRWVEAYLWQHIEKEQDQVVTSASRHIEIPVQYGGVNGPDLPYVAQHCGLSEAEVIDWHSRAVYQVYLLGFVPGFAYLGGLNEKLATPRKHTPRQGVPAGSVGIAGAQTGIYPVPITGGWQIIGRTSLTLFDVRENPPARLQAGDTVTFVPIS